MIPARLRYIALALTAYGLLILGLLWLLEGVWAGAVVCLWLTGLCALGCARIRHTVGHHQDEQAAELEAVFPDGWVEPWAGWCCERGWATRGGLHHPAACTRTAPAAPEETAR
ncbi:hypothetical protein ACFWOS_06135 [Streptomyces rubiginosohelvolus]|uniref:hypothetical protein n=1 Tax=Streptomyces rubiginosohelvolus TaxID=67362 RepID=UPI003650452B